MTKLSSLTTYLNRLKSQLPYLPWILRLVWQAAPLYTGLSLLFMLLNSLIPLVLVFLSREIINRIQAHNALNISLIYELSLPLGLAIVLLALNQLLQLGLRYLRIAQAEYTQDYLSQLIQEKTISLDLSFFDSQDYYDMLYRSYADALDKPARLINSLGDLFSISLTLLGMLFILATYAIWLPLLIFLSALPLVYFLLRYTLIYRNWRLESSSKERQSQYLNWLLVDRQAAPELRLFALGEYHKAAYSRLRTSLRNERLALERQKFGSQLLAFLVSLLVVIPLLVWMLQQGLSGVFSFGDLAVFAQIFFQTQSLSGNFLSNATDIYQNILFIENLYLFLQLESCLKDEPSQAPVSMPLREGISFENVSFRYPERQAFVLENFNWFIPANRIIALIGQNGEGKSTLLKLLCRFYDPDEGRILWDGQDIKELPLDALRDSISVLFQEPMHYIGTVHENIALGELSKSVDAAMIEKVSHYSGADSFIRELPQDYQTLLGTWFGGAEISLGQWQRLALARAFLKESGILILDEPSSALDAWAEADFLNRFRSAASNKTSIMITHRFTTAIYADRIDILQDGRIIESGSHEELIALEGRYAQAWQAQTASKVRGGE